jgi:hypothetical protein
MHILKMVVKFCTTKDLSNDCKNIVLNLFKFVQLEKGRGRPLYSPDNLIKKEHASLLAYLTVLCILRCLYMLRCQKIGL